MRLPWHGIQPSAADLSSIRKKLIDHGRFLNRPRSVPQSTTVSFSIDHGRFFNRPRSVLQSTTVSSSIDHGQFLNRPRSVPQSTTVGSSIDHGRFYRQCAWGGSKNHASHWSILTIPHLIHTKVAPDGGTSCMVNNCSESIPMQYARIPTTLSLFLISLSSCKSVHLYYQTHASQPSIT